MTIDVHAHTVPAPFIERLATEVPAIAPKVVQHDDGFWFEYPDGRRSGPVPAGMFDMDARLADMDATGITMQALSVPPPHFNYKLGPRQAAVAARLHNDAMIDMARQHPDRFTVLGHLPLQDEGDALEELARLVADPLVAGVELGTNVDGRNLDHESLEAVWAALEQSGMAIVLHPSDVVGGADRMHDHYVHNFVGNPTDTTLAAASLMYGGVLSRYPGLRFGLLHAGGFLPYQIGRFDHGWRVRPEPQVHLDRAPSELLHDHFWFDTLAHDDASLRFLIERVGASRVFLGSDYPFDMADMDPVPTVRRALASTDVDLDQILVRTAEGFLTRRPASIAVSVE